MKPIMKVICLIFIIFETIQLNHGYAEDFIVTDRVQINNGYFENRILLEFIPQQNEIYYQIPEGTIGISSDAFKNASTLECVYIPSTCTMIGLSKEHSRETSVYRCPNGFENMKCYSVSAHNPYFASKDGVLFSKDGTILYQYPIGREDISYIIPDGVVKIAPRAFAGASLKEISFPDTLQSIDEEAFHYTQLESVRFPNNLVQIGCYAFAQSPLANVTFSETIKIINAGAFEGCRLTNLILPPRLEYLDSFAFFGNPIAADEIILLPETLKYIGDDIFQYGTSSWDAWTPIFAVFPKSKGYDWVANNFYSYIIVEN